MAKSRLKKIKQLIIFLGVGSLSVSCGSANSKLNTLVPTANTYLVTNVTVIPMNQPGTREGVTVFIKEGRINRIFDQKAAVPLADVRSIDGTGKYLIPALADMHTHINDEADLTMYLANGVTLVRAMGDSTWWARLMGFAHTLRLRNQIASGELIGPRIITTGLILEGDPQTSPMMKQVLTTAEARQTVRKWKEDQLDFVKVYDHLTPEIFATILDEARNQGLPVAGHVPKQVPLMEGLRSGIVSIEHLTGYFDNDHVTFGFEEQDRSSIIQATIDNTVWNVPTLVIFNRLVPIEEIDTIENLEQMKYMGWKTYFWWRQTVKAVYENQRYNGPKEAYANVCLDHMARLTRDLYHAGAPLMVGTDANFVGVFPGFSVHEEMGLLVEKAGLSNFEALRAATVHPAKFLNQQLEFGSIQEGLRADLVLLRSNPLVDIHHTRTIEGVFLNGRWFSKAHLQSGLSYLE